MNLYISDLHFGHKNVIAHDNRPFRDCDEMDHAMIQLWNARVSQDDNVYIVGDFAYKSERDETWYLRQLRGHKHLIIGNHDGKLLKNSLAMAYFDSVDKMMHISDGNTQIVLCHYPMAEWYKSNYGSWLIYGHIHIQKTQTYNYMRTLERALNAAACINNYAPASFEELKRNNKLFKQV